MADSTDSHLENADTILSVPPELEAPRRVQTPSAALTRRKTPEACERCRKKRIKCDGVNPCNQCSTRGQTCEYTSLESVGRDTLASKIDLILNRLDRIESTLSQQRIESSAKSNDKSMLQVNQAPMTYVEEYNEKTGCFELYGDTSTFVFAKSLGKRLRKLDDDACLPMQKRVCLDSSSDMTGRSRLGENLGLAKLLGFHDYVVPYNVAFRHRSLQKVVADRHIRSFFQTIHIFFPIFDEERFRAKYERLRGLFGDNLLFVPSQEHQSQQFLCLLYAVLALGALYEYGRDDSSSWATWYFGEAQYLLGRLLDAVNLDLVQAVMLMGAYAQHAIKPNLAYNLIGISTRLAFSLGLNLKPTRSSHDFDVEEAKRTWWLLYIQEVELSLDSGRAMCVRDSDIHVEYPRTDAFTTRNLDHEDASESRITFIPCIAEIAKIFRQIMKLQHDCQPVSHISIDEISNDLFIWRDSLPRHLRFQNEETSDSAMTDHPCSWKARQRSSMRIHYNLALIILHRKWLLKPETSPHDSCPSIYRAACLDASSDMILHIHHIFTLAPELRRWSYYCYYCLQAVLVLLLIIIDEPNTKELGKLLGLCEISIQIFTQIEIRAAERCADVVRNVLNQCKSKAKTHDNLPRKSLECFLQQPLQQMSGVSLSSVLDCSFEDAQHEFPETQTSESGAGNLDNDFCRRFLSDHKEGFRGSDSILKDPLSFLPGLDSPF